MYTVKMLDPTGKSCDFMLEILNKHCNTCWKYRIVLSVFFLGGGGGEGTLKQDYDWRDGNV